MPTAYDKSKVYDDEETGSRTPAQIAADDQKKAELRDLEASLNAPEPTKESQIRNLKGNEAAAASGPYAKNKEEKTPPEQPEKLGQKLKGRFQAMSNRRKAGYGMAVGGTGIVMLIMTLFSSTYQIPSMMGGLENNNNASRMTRYIRENRMEKIVVEWQIRKKLGQLNDESVVKKGSIMGTLYKAFDAINLERMIQRDQGLEFVKGSDGKVHVVMGKRDVGTINSWKDYQALKKKDRKLAVASKRMVTHTMTFDQFGKSIVKRAITNYWGHRFAPPEWDDSKSREENLKIRREYQIDMVSKGTTLRLFNGVMCLFEGQCDSFAENSKPVDTATESPRQISRTPGELKNKSAKAVVTEIESAAEEAKAKAAQNGTSYIAELRTILRKKITDVLVSKISKAVLPVIGQVDLMAELDHIGWNANTNHLLDRVPVALREDAYAAMFATWIGFAHNIKLGKMDLAHVNELNAQMAGASGALTYNYLYKGVSNKGEPVDPPVGSSKQHPMRATQDFLYRKTTYRIGHAFFDKWYTFVTPILSFIGDRGADILIWIIRASPGMAAFEKIMQEVFGENWEQEFSMWAMDGILDVFAISIDPLARGAKLFNYLYTGTDVVMNTYCQTNLGCMALTDLSDKGFFDLTMMLREDQELRVSGLSMKERLFSVDESSSLVNAAIREMPAQITPGSTVSTVFNQLSLIPARLLGIVSGRTYAAETPQQDVAITEVRPFGYPTAESLDYPTPPEFFEEANPTCPENNNSKVNPCQTEKEVIKGGMCVGTFCPEMTDPVTQSSPSVSTSGPVSTTGDIKALAAQLLRLKDSGQIKMNSEVVRDLEHTRDGAPIGTCGVKDLDAALLNLLVRIAQKYKFTIWNIVTGHECNFARNHFHPKGQATDIGAVNGEPANLGQGFRPLMNATLAREFALYVAGSMPEGRGGMGQSDCSVLAPVNNWPPGVEMFSGDSCNHFHVDVGDYQ